MFLVQFHIILLLYYTKRQQNLCLLTYHLQFFKIFTRCIYQNHTEQSTLTCFHMYLWVCICVHKVKPYTVLESVLLYLLCMYI